MRYYRQWAGNPKGTPENLKNCVVEVHDSGRSPLSHQCMRRRGYGEDGLFCVQHAKRPQFYIPKNESRTNIPRT